MGLLRSLIREVLDQAKPKEPRQTRPPDVEDGYKPASPATATVGAAPQASPMTKPDAAAYGYASEPPAPAPAEGHRERRGRRSREREDGEEGRGGGFGGKYVACFQVATNADKRRTHSLFVMHAFAYSIIIVGIIFLVLVCTGDFPTSVENQKYLGVYVDNVVKYSLYIFSGVSGVAAVLMSKASLLGGKGLGLPMLAMILVELSLLATIGQSIYIMTLGSIYSAWWGWLLAALMLVQRLLYLLATFFAHYTLWEAGRDPAVRQRIESVY